ncbi:MAG: hypothetical protein B0A82_26760 [Alkalinema sp. CACIAM 70d]|nr:MAG: hypothetical protein B0A82_26760 [Alkalinema sp. CACIAM 70d]
MNSENQDFLSKPWTKSPRFNELVELIRKEDVEGFNKKRRENPDCMESMESMNLMNEGFKNISLKRINFSKLVMYKTQFGKVDLRGANLTNSDLSDAELTEVNLEGAILDGINLQSAKLTSSNLTGIRLSHWLINDDTEFVDCKCNHIFIGEAKIDIPQGLTVLFLEELKECSKNLEHSSRGLEMFRERWQPRGSTISGNLDPLRADIEAEFGHGSFKSYKPTSNANIFDEVTYLRARLQSLTYQQKLITLAEKEKPSLIKKALPYAIATLAFLTFAVFLARTYNKDRVQISITYDVGTITGGILAGSAAMIAAIAYARKSAMSENNPGSERRGE